MKQTNYKKSIHSLKGLFLTGLILLSSSLFAQQVVDINYQKLDFGADASPKVVGSNGALVAYSPSNTNNANASGSKVLYTNVITVGTTRIDCLVTNLEGSTTFDASGSTSGSTDFINTADRMFNPTVIVSSTNRLNGFQFEFGTAVYNNGNFSSITPINLINLVLNVYDVDRDNSGNGNLTNSVLVSTITNSIPNYSSIDRFGSFSNYTNSNDLEIQAPNGQSLSSLSDDNGRIRYFFNQINNFTIELGGRDRRGTSQSFSGYATDFFLDFALGNNFSGGTTTIDNPTNGISLDLSGSSNLGNNNSATYNTTNSTSNFTVASTTNLSILNSTSASRLTNITVKFNTADILGGANEVLRIGSTDIPLNADLSSRSLTLNSVSYDYVVTTTNSVRTIAFSRISGTTNNFTQAQGEALLDALQYVNKSTTGNIGTRIFNVNATLDLTTDITSPSAFFTVNIPTALPVNIISFTGKATANGNQLNWTVAQEENFSHYEVLSSINGSTYNKVGEVYPENKSMDMKNYAFTDLSATADLVFYKLNLINEDGSSDFSNIVAINRNSVAPVITNVYPNPATTSLLVSLEGVDTEVSTITIQDLSGKIVYSTETSDVATLLNINELNKGLYLIKVSNSNGIVSVSRFAKN